MNDERTGQKKTEENTPRLPLGWMEAQLLCTSLHFRWNCMHRVHADAQHGTPKSALPGPVSISKGINSAVMILRCRPRKHVSRRGVGGTVGGRRHARYLPLRFVDFLVRHEVSLQWKRSKRFGRGSRRSVRTTADPTAVSQVDRGW